MGFAGEIKTIGLPELFKNLAFNRMTGVLCVRGDGVAVEIFFQDGRIRAHGGEFDYEEIAIRSGAASAEAVEAVRDRGKRFSLKRALAATTNDFDAERYDRAVAAAVESETLRIFPLEDITFEFEEEPPGLGRFDNEQLDCALAIDANNLAVEAGSRSDGNCASEDEVLITVDPGGVNAAESPEAAALLPLLDGTRDLATAIEQLPYPRFAMLQLAARLIDQQVVTQASPTRLAELAQSATKGGAINRAAVLINTAIARDPENLDLRRQLVELFRDAGRNAEAALANKRLGTVQEELGDLKGALASYGEAAELAPHDTDALERMVAIHDARDDLRAYLKVGRTLASAHTAHGRPDRAVAILRELLERDPDNIPLRETLATTYIKMHERENATQELLSLAESAAAVNGFHKALRYYRSVLAVDRHCDVAARRIEEIESSRAKERVRGRRRRFFWALASVVLALGLLQGVREALAQEALNDAADASYGATTAESLAYYSRVCRDFPLTRGAFRGKQMVRLRLLGALEEIRVRLGHDPDAAERAVRELGRIDYPEGVRAFWNDARDRMLRRFAGAENVTSSPAKPSPSRRRDR